jgi:arabinose-5-phosphate isomerase
MMSNNQTVGEKMLELGNFPVLSPRDTLKKALDEMTEFRLGIALIVDEGNRLLGVLTDGDLRRLLLTRQSPLPALLVTPAIEFGNKAPKVIGANMDTDEAKANMLREEIWDLPVVDKDGSLIGLVHRHSLN